MQRRGALRRRRGIFEPCFLVLGPLLALVSYGFAPTATRGRQRTLPMLATLVLTCAFGLGLAVTQHTFAVS